MSYRSAPSWGLNERAATRFAEAYKSGLSNSRSLGNSLTNDFKPAAQARSLKDLLLILEKIDKSGAGFRSVTEHVGTTTPAGRMMMQMLGSFAEFERSMIRERTRAGLAAAKEDGRVGGRPRSLNDKQRREIADAVLSGRKTAADMARLFGASPATRCLPECCRHQGRAD